MTTPLQNLTAISALVVAVGSAYIAYQQWQVSKEQTDVAIEAKNTAREIATPNLSYEYTCNATTGKNEVFLHIQARVTNVGYYEALLEGFNFEITAFPNSQIPYCRPAKYVGNDSCDREHKEYPPLTTATKKLMASNERYVAIKPSMSMDFTFNELISYNKSYSSRPYLLISFVPIEKRLSSTDLLSGAFSGLKCSINGRALKKPRIVSTAGGVTFEEGALGLGY